MLSIWWPQGPHCPHSESTAPRTWGTTGKGFFRAQEKLFRNYLHLVLSVLAGVLWWEHEIKSLDLRGKHSVGRIQYPGFKLHFRQSSPLFTIPPFPLQCLPFTSSFSYSGEGDLVRKSWGQQYPLPTPLPTLNTPLSKTYIFLFSVTYKNIKL